MFVSRVLSRVCRSVSRSSPILSASQRPQQSRILSNHFHSLVHPSPNAVIPVQVNSLWLPINASSTPRCGFSSSASPDEPNEKEHANATTDEAEICEAATQTKESDSKSEFNMFRDDLVKLIAEKEELLKLKLKDIENMHDQVLRTLAEMKDVMDRTRREAEDSKNISIKMHSKDFSKGIFYFLLVLLFLKLNMVI